MKTTTTEHVELIREAARTLEQTNTPVTRGNIKKLLGWSFRRWGTIQTICNKHQIAVQSAHDQKIYMREQEILVCGAAYLLTQTNTHITRADIRQKLGWSSKSWDIIQAVCHSHHITLEEKGVSER